MKRYVPTIKVALDKCTGEILKAETVFGKKKPSFDVRREFSEGKIDIYCLECDQKLWISTSKRDQLYFRHGPNDGICLMADQTMSQEERDVVHDIHIAKESQRHKDLKKLIAERLKCTEGVDPDSIQCDDKCIIREDGRRRPDVYCKYLGKEVVFEIQLSSLSLRYILSRYQFYKKYGIYLIWVLEEFELDRQGQLQRDIKYLAKHQNFFKLTDTEGGLRLRCDFKKQFVRDGEEVIRDAWNHTIVSLAQLNFAETDMQVFYHDAGAERNRMEEIIAERKASRIHAEAASKAKGIIEGIKMLKGNAEADFSEISAAINAMNEVEVKTLNEVLNLKGKVHPLVVWIKEARQNNIPFLSFLLSCRQIEMDLGKTVEGKRTAFIELIENQHLISFPVWKLLNERGYHLLEVDKDCLKEKLHFAPSEAQVDLLLELENRLGDCRLSPTVWKYFRQVRFVESAKNGKISGFNYQQPDLWVSFGNTALEEYSRFWSYTRKALDHYGVMDKIKKMDHKGTFARKMSAVNDLHVASDQDLSRLLADLYPEVFGRVESLI